MHVQPLERSNHHEHHHTNATEYRDLPLALLTESTTNPRRIFEEDALKELAESIRTQGVLSPLLVRPIERAQLRDRLRSTALPRRADGRGRDRARPYQATLPMPKRWKRS